MRLKRLVRTYSHIDRQNKDGWEVYLHTFPDIIGYMPKTMMKGANRHRKALISIFSDVSAPSIDDNSLVFDVSTKKKMYDRWCDAFVCTVDDQPPKFADLYKEADYPDVGCLGVVMVKYEEGHLHSAYGIDTAVLTRREGENARLIFKELGMVLERVLTGEPYNHGKITNGITSLNPVLTMELIEAQEPEKLEYVINKPISTHTGWA